jgi:hypothetical protein
MLQLVQSVKERGIITPVTLRRRKTAGMRSYPATDAKRPVKSQDLRPFQQRSRN